MKDLPCVDLMSPSEFAEWSGLNINTVYRLKNAGKLPVIQMSERRYFIDIKKFMEQAGFQLGTLGQKAGALQRG